jgi:hypothetical protein
VLGVPDERTLQVAIAFGYPTAEYLHPPRKGGRITLESILHRDTWGNR